MSHDLVAELDHVTIRRAAVSAMDNNAYLITARSDGSQLLIDAAAEPAKLRQLIVSAAGDAAVGTRLAAIFTTHQHSDHTGALAALADEFPRALTLAGVDDAEAIEARTGVGIGRRVEHGDEVELGELRLQVIGLRGHTPGSVALAYAEAGAPVQLFTGDSLFPGGVGNTNGDPKRFASLYADVVARIFEVYSDETLVHPGHGKPTTLGAERPRLGEWRSRGW